MRLSVVLALLQQPAAPAQAPFPIAKVVVTPPAGEIQVGQTVRLSAQALDSAGKPVAGSKVAWFAGGTEGSVDSTGLVTGGYSGHVRVYAVGLVPGQNGQKVTEVVITVLPEPPARVVVTPYSKHDDVRHDPVTFVSSNPRVAAVTPDGAVHALAAGRATITAAAGPATATLAVQVVANTIVKLAVEPAATSVRTGDVVRFTAQTKDATGRPVRDVAVQWSLTAGPGVAQLDPQGAFVAELPGSYTVTAAVGARSSDAVVRVEQRRVTRGIEVRAHLPIKFSSAEVWMHPSGKCVYLTTIADRVYVIDVSDWTAPKIVDSMLTNARIVNDIMTTEDGKYGVFSREGASDRKNGIVVFDAHDPCHPRAIAEYTETVSGGVHSSYVYQGRAYITDDATGSMRVIDFRDATHPREVARWQAQQTEAGRYLHDIMVKDG